MALRLLRLLSLMGLLLLDVSCSLRLERSRRSSMARRIDDILRRPELKGSTVGIEVRRLADGDVLYENGADRLLAPASTAKIISAGGALLALSPDFRFVTRLRGTGEFREGVLRGDLVMIASGDPNLSQRASADELSFVDNDHSYAGFLDSAEVVPGDPLAVLRALAEEARAQGLRKVEGAVVVDEGFFEERSDEFLQGPLSAACVNDNLVDVVVTPAARTGEAPTIQVLPLSPAVQVENRARTVRPGEEGPPPRLEYRGGPAGGPARFRLNGSIAVGSRPVLCVAPFPDPALTAAHLLAGELTRAGIEVSDAPRREARGPMAYRGPELAAYTSPPLSEAVRVVLKVSHNLHASMLPVVVGAVKGGAGNRFAGYRVIREILAGEGMDVDRVVLRSGSGGARADCLSARFLVSVLSVLARRPEAAAFYRALPLGGGDGTLASNFRSPRFSRRVRAKTGTLVFQGALNGRWVYLSKALAGYLELEEPRGPAIRPGKSTVAFAILITNATAANRKEGSEALFRAQEDILGVVLDYYGR